MTFLDTWTIWQVIALLILPTWYFIEVAVYIYYNTNYADVVDAAEHSANQRGITLDKHASNLGLKGVSYFILIPHAFYLGHIYKLDEINGWVFWPIIALGVSANFMSKENRYLSKLILIANTEKKDTRAEKEFQSHFHDVGGEEAGDFDYDESKFSGHEASTGDRAPRGFDQRHPDDSKLWAVVDDPAASDGERKNAFEAILKKQAKRQGKTGRDVSPTMH